MYELNVESCTLALVRSVAAHAACLSVLELLGSAHPLAKEKLSACVWRGGLGSATSSGIDRIKLDSSEINTKDTSATHSSRRGCGWEKCRQRNISRKATKLELFYLVIYISKDKRGPRWIFFFQPSGDTNATRTELN